MLESIIRYESESHKLDYKKKPYELSVSAAKFEFIKDISAMANNPSRDDKFIVIEVKEENGLASKFYPIDAIEDQAVLQQILDAYIEPSIRFEYCIEKFEEHQLAYFRLFDNEDRPYLFKKNAVINDPKPKIKFNMGEGVIRVGTSTRKLLRPDFDQIYQAKFESPDRKRDLKIELNVHKLDKKVYRATDRCLDISIENTSNKSIGFDAMMSIQFDSKKLVASRDKLERSFIIPTGEGKFGFTSFTAPLIPNLDITIEENNDSLLIWRLARMGEKYAVELSQQSIYRAIFLKSLVLLNRPTGCMKITITLKSDDFTAGPLIKEYRFNMEHDL